VAEDDVAIADAGVGKDTAGCGMQGEYFAPVVAESEIGRPMGETELALKL
jgi:hypothetical protein